MMFQVTTATIPEQKQTANESASPSAESSDSESSDASQPSNSRQQKFILYCLTQNKEEKFQCELTENLFHQLFDNSELTLKDADLLALCNAFQWEIGADHGNKITIVPKSVALLITDSKQKNQQLNRLEESLRQLDYPANKKRTASTASCSTFATHRPCAKKQKATKQADSDEAACASGYESDVSSVTHASDFEGTTTLGYHGYL